MALPPSEILRIGRPADTAGPELCLLFTHPLDELLEDEGRSGMDVVTLESPHPTISNIHPGHRETAVWSETGRKAYPKGDMKSNRA